MWEGTGRTINRTLNNFRAFFSDWAGGEIQQLNVDRTGVRLVAVLSWTNTSSHWVPKFHRGTDGTQTRRLSGGNQ
jgi:hypothetical protein